MDAMHYYDGRPSLTLDYRHSPHHGYHHGAYHPAFAQSIGLHGRPTAQISASTPLYRSAGAGSIHSQYDGPYRDLYDFDSPISYDATAESRAAYGNRMAAANPNSVGIPVGFGSGGYTSDHPGDVYYGYRPNSYRMPTEYSQYHHHAFQQHHQHHQQPPHLHHTPHHPHYHHNTSSEIMYHPQTTHLLGQPTHNHHHPYMNRSVGGYSYSGYPSEAELAYQHTPYQHHRPQHPPTIHHPHQTFPMLRAPLRDLYGAGAAETHSSTASSSSSPSVYQLSPATAIDPLAATTPSCEAVAADSPATTTPSATHHPVPPPSLPSPSSSAPTNPSTSSTKTSPPSANANTTNDIRSTTSPPTPLAEAAAAAAPTLIESTTNGSIFGGNAAEQPATHDRATPFTAGDSGGTLLADELRGANCTYPTPPPSTAPVDATANTYGQISKETPAIRKSQHRDKHLSKMAAMNRRLEETTAFGTSLLPIHDIERSSTPFQGGNTSYRDYLTMRTHTYHMHQHHTKYTNYPTMSSQAASIPMSSPWHPITNGTDWMNSPHNIRPNSYYRNHLPMYESGRNLLPAAMSSSKNCNSDDRNSRSSHHLKSVSKVLESDFIPSKKRRRNLSPVKGDEADLKLRREAFKKITPLPGFQQAFGSTEIGRFSEVFFNAPESPVEPFGHIGGYVDSEADTLSPQPWETGDSMEGTNFHLPLSSGSVQSIYAESYTSTGSPSSSYFSEIRCGDF